MSAVNCGCPSMFITSRRIGGRFEFALETGCQCCGANAGAPCNAPEPISVPENGKHPAFTWGDFCPPRLARLL